MQKILITNEIQSSCNVCNANLSKYIPKELTAILASSFIYACSRSSKDYCRVSNILDLTHIDYYLIACLPLSACSLRMTA